MRGSPERRQIELDIPQSERRRPRGQSGPELPPKLSRIAEDMEVYAIDHRQPGSPVTVPFPDGLSEMERRAVFEQLKGDWPIALRQRVGTGEVVVLGESVPGDRD